MTTIERAPTPRHLRVRVTALSIGCAILGIAMVLELFSLLVAAGGLGASAASTLDFGDEQVLSVFVMTASAFLIVVAALLVHLSRRFDAPEE